jgi:hypothetical protein
MAVVGVITSKHVFRHAWTIVREFGLAVCVQCLLAIFRRRRTTFVSCVFWNH